jgi:hypothetical protein
MGAMTTLDGRLADAPDLSDTNYISERVYRNAAAFVQSHPANHSQG